MVIEKLTTREQFLIFLVAATFVLGAYALFRFVPQNKVVAEKKAELVANQEKIKNPTFVDEPIDKPEKIALEIKQTEASLIGLNEELLQAEKRLAPIGSPVEVQDVVVRISEAARISGLKVVKTQAYAVEKKEADKNAVKAPPAKLSRSERRAARAEKKKARAVAAYASNAIESSTVALGKPKEGELVYQLVNNLKTSRPIQQYYLQGNFYGLWKFIEAVKTQPYQVTIVKLDVSATKQTPPPGVPQPLNIILFIAM